MVKLSFLVNFSYGLVCYSCDSAALSSCTSGPWISMPCKAATTNAICYTRQILSGGSVIQTIRNFTNTCTSATTTTAILTCCSLDYCNGNSQFVALTANHGVDFSAFKAIFIVLNALYLIYFKVYY